ncbi:hypothetical protein GCM10007320_44300 [Pseudorhodoferax aquiterrae]|uniref:Uncharacterized protein n=1 Tax=Pseudorhodoferax aquiterrae TaxID=747304 RepID=A0ABQ3G6E9_9BURK|nr:hypothetical protein [Pseudorhodoferax aquiterrae]GHC93397.1 hypothetical protein GCM10007320_44300 [Pseudorhodoferax aquiterrae]
MHVSPFFRNLRTAYLAELDDMRQDSEGANVLDRRLAERRKEIGFLVAMLELSPEMVAVVLHKAFQFRSGPAMERLLACEAGNLTAWDSLQQNIVIAPWAQATVQQLRKHPAGDNFLSVAAALEYMVGSTRQAAGGADQGDDADDVDAEHDDDRDDEERQPLSADDLDDADAQTREDARADWMAEQGFDRKE